MGRPPCCDKANVKRGLWTAEEDAKILAYVSTHGIGNWTLVPKKAGLNRCGKSCRLRWTNYLRPDLKHSEFTPQEEQLIIDLHQAIGSRWSLIAKQLPGRTDNDVKNHWNTKLKKRLIKMAIDPLTHKPLSQIFSDYENVSGSHTHPHPHAHVLQQNLPLPQPPLDLKSRSFLCGLTSLDIPMFPITEQQLPHADFTHISASNLHLFDQVSPSCSSSSSPSSSVTSSLQSISSNRPSFAWSSDILQFDPSPHTNRRQQNDYTFQAEDYSTQEKNDAPQPQGIHQGGDYKNGPVADGESGAAPSDFKDNFVTEETGMSACYQPIPAPVNSFVKAILDRDSQLQLEFPVFDDILDY